MTPKLEHLSLHVERLKLRPSARLANLLYSLDIRFLGELAQRGRDELLDPRKIGKKTIREVESLLAAYGLTLGTTLDPDLKQAFDTEVARLRSGQKE